MEAETRDQNPQHGHDQSDFDITERSRALDPKDKSHNPKFLRTIQKENNRDKYAHGQCPMSAARGMKQEGEIWMPVAL